MTDYTETERLGSYALDGPAIRREHAADVRARDPIALAGMTVRAVDQIGEAAAAEIERAACELQDRAAEIALKLRELAAAMRERSRIAGERVAEFVDQFTIVVETVRILQSKLHGGNGDGRG